MMHESVSHSLFTFSTLPDNFRFLSHKVLYRYFQSEEFSHCLHTDGDTRFQNGSTGI